MRFDVAFAGDRILLPDGVLRASAVRDADPTAAPPEIRTVSGETVFVPAPQRAGLERFCEDNGIPRLRRPDVWGDLLEPFLDTVFDPRHQAATLDRLERLGVGRAEAASIRDRVAPLMTAYNAVHGDWHHLGLADLLDAASAAVPPGHPHARPGDPAAFRSWAMAIADRGRSPDEP
ncbi:hypothetical protein ACGFYQ_21450 [Streptomyces sp. NPDC048258]|uniref:hypothetical protein n=1 Tax=Streptomyces sp. NPDC048258 TaxID=3365527 RepID=UPI003716E195